MIHVVVRHSYSRNLAEDQGRFPYAVEGICPPGEVRRLLRAGADPWINDKKGRTALDFVRAGERADRARIIEILEAAMKPPASGARRDR